MSEEDGKRINQFRAGKVYLDLESAKIVLGSAFKKDISENPFVTFFDYGKNKEGYWTYDHFVLQCKEVLDCLQVLYPQFDFGFSVDHSCGHDRQKLDGICFNAMNVNLGGNQRLIHGFLNK